MSAYTPEQHAAVHLAANLAVTAGAGAGKTRVLVDRFLRLLTEPGVEVENLVAITFTEKAAREMRDRLRCALQQRARAGDGQARHLLARLDLAHIQTLHSFCQWILRTYPVEAGLDPDFRVVDDLEAGLLLDEAVTAALDEAVAAEKEAVVELLARYPLPELSRGLAALIQRLRNLGLTPAEVRALTARTAAQQAAEGPRIEAAVLAAVERILSHPTRPGTKGYDQQQAFRAAWEHLGLWQPEVHLPALRALCAQLDARTRLPKKELEEALDQWERTAANSEALAVAGALLDLAEEAVSRYRAALEGSDAVDLPGLVERAHQLLAGDPAVRKQVAGRLRAVFVDEFQDTDRLQWELIRLLLGDPLPPDRLFVVGDPQQSIYRFRGARVELFHAAREAIGAAGGQEVPLRTNFRAQGNLVRLTNHLFERLMPGYEPMAVHRPPRDPAAEVLVAAPAPDPQGAAPAPDPRDLEAELLAARIAQMVRDRERLVWEEGPDGTVTVRPVEYRDIAILLQAMTQVDLYCLALARAGVPYYVVAGDGFFAQQEVRDVYNLLAVLASPADDLALLGLLRSPFVGLSDEALFRLCQRAPAAGAGPGSDPPSGAATGAGAPAAPAPGRLYAALMDPTFALPSDEQPLLDRVRALLPALRQVAWQEPLAEVLPALYDATGIAPVLAARPDGLRRLANLEKLAALVRRLSRSSLRQFPDLVRWLRVCMDQAVREGLAATEEETGDTVRILTVHKAKGLEFPVVCLPDLARPLRDDYDPFLVHPDVGLAPALRAPGGERRSLLRDAALAAGRAAAEAEFLRLFYVAVTRARDYLVLCVRPALQGRPTWQGWLAAAAGVDWENPPPALELGGVAVRVVTPGQVPPPAGAPAAGAPAAPPSWLCAPPGAGLGEPVPPEVAGLLARVGPVVPARAREGVQVAVTALLDYQDCPRKYYLKHVLRVPEWGPGALAGGAPGANAVTRPGALALTGDLSGVALDPEGETPTGAWLPDGGHAAPLAAGPALAPALRGQVVHWVCEHLQDPAGLEGLIRQAAAAYRVDPEDPAFAAAVRGPLLRYVASDLFARVRAARAVHSEVPVRLQVGALVVEGQVDKVLTDGCRATVVDFKTNQVEDEGQLQALADHYRLQVQVYSLAVAERLGLQVDEAVLHFLLPGRSVPVAPDPAGTRARLEQLGEALAAAHGWEDFVPHPAHCPACPYRDLCRVE